MTKEMECLSTPILRERAGTCQLINHSWGYLCGYELPTGKELWHFHSPGQYIIVTPVAWNDLIIVGGGEGSGRCFLGVSLEEERGVVKPKEVWRAKRNLPETASPVVYGPYVYTITRGGIASCLEARSGKVVWVQRLRGQYDASLAAGDGKIYFCNTDGMATVVAAGETFRILKSNPIDEPVRASFAISGGKIFLRGEKHLFSIGEGVPGWKTED
jgi:outer membrane protein assembly factor BamB